MTTTLETSYEACRVLNRRYGTTYYWSTYLLPKVKRHHVHALYGFCRYADEIVDDPAFGSAALCAGDVDADGHVLEPGDLWETYLEDKYKARALRIKVDADGYEYLEIDQRPSQRTIKGSLGILGAMGSEDLRPRPDRRYADNMPFGSSAKSCRRCKPSIFAS